MEIVVGDIIVLYLNDKAYPYDWELKSPVVVKLSNKERMQIKAGFVTDFASVPRIFWSIISPRS